MVTKKEKNTTRSYPLSVRITNEEHEMLKKLAKRRNKRISTLAHALLIEALTHHL